MSESTDLPEALDGEALAADLQEKIRSLVCALVEGPDEAAREGLEHLLERAKDLVQRKRAMEGSKHDTRHLMMEVVFTRLRRAMGELLGKRRLETETDAAKWVIGSLFSIASLSDFAAAVDRAIIQSSGPRDFTFAGRTDFICITDVLQMLASNIHPGCLSLEKDDNRLDIYISAGHIWFLDPHHMIRRVMPSDEPMSYREISDADLRAVEARRDEDGTPTFLALNELGVFGKEPIRKVMAMLGREVLYEFLRDQENCMFFYRRLDEVPDFVTRHDLRLGVTPTLLEGNRQLDEWRSMCEMFPDPDAAIQPQPDMYSRISELDLGVHEIKLLTHINGSNSPRQLARLVGMPLHSTYQHLVRFAREDVIVVPGGFAAIADLTVSLEDSMQAAFDCLDANDTDPETAAALDRVLGTDDLEDNVRSSLLDALHDD